MITGALAEVQLTVGSFGLLNSSCGISPECIIGIDIFRSWENSHVGSLTCGVRAVMVGKTRWKSL